MVQGKLIESKIAHLSLHESILLKECLEQMNAREKSIELAREAKDEPMRNTLANLRINMPASRFVQT